MNNEQTIITEYGTKDHVLVDLNFLYDCEIGQEIVVGNQFRKTYIIISIAPDHFVEKSVTTRSRTESFVVRRIKAEVKTTHGG